ncbi:MAG: hypothetical protein ABID54_01195 [Pseudomonadota bacterium]
MLKSISASVIFREHPEVKQESFDLEALDRLWDGEFGEDEYSFRMVENGVTADVIRY